MDSESSQSVSSSKYKIADIGCGCSKPVFDLIDFCSKNPYELFLIDCQEMLDHLPNEPFITKIPAEFPKDPIFHSLTSSFDYIICYSVIQIVPDYLLFIDEAFKLLAPNGKMLIGDIPNIQKKKRFLQTKNGEEFHRKWSNSANLPKITQEDIENNINDEKILHILQRYRSKGAETFLLQQEMHLPLCNSREDILIIKNC